MNKNDLEIDHNIRSTWLTIRKMYDEQASKFDSTMVVGFTLLSIDPKNGTPSTSLGPKMGVSSTSLSRTLKKLEDRGLIYRKPNPEDGRSVLISLTPDGMEMRDVSKEVVLKFYRAIDERITKKEIEIFEKVLEKISFIATDKSVFHENK